MEEAHVVGALDQTRLGEASAALERRHSNLVHPLEVDPETVILGEDDPDAGGGQQEVERPALFGIRYALARLRDQPVALGGRLDEMRGGMIVLAEVLPETPQDRSGVLDPTRVPEIPQVPALAVLVQIRAQIGEELGATLHSLDLRQGIACDTLFQHAD